MSLVDCDGFLPPDEPDCESVGCSECGGTIWVSEGEFVRTECGLVCARCEPAVEELV